MSEGTIDPNAQLDATAELVPEGAPTGGEAAPVVEAAKPDPVAVLQALQAARAAHATAKAALDAAEATLAGLARDWKTVVADIEADFASVGGFVGNLVEAVKADL